MKCTALTTFLEVASFPECDDDLMV